MGFSTSTCTEFVEVLASKAPVPGGGGASALVAAVGTAPVSYTHLKEVAEAVDCPLVVEGCKNVEKDAELLPKVAEVLQERNALILSEKEENYKAIGAAAGLAYNQIVGAESAVDILSLIHI